MADLTLRTRETPSDEEVRDALRLLVRHFGGLIVLGSRGQSCVAFLNGSEQTVPAKWTVDYPTKPAPGGPMRCVRITAGWTERQWRALQDEASEAVRS